LKLNATQGILLATAILAVIGGVIAELNNYVTTQDLSALGQYGVYLKAFMTGAPVLVFATWIYNVFMYVRQKQIAALKQVTELYDTTKLVKTIALFTSIIGPIVTFLPQYKEVGALVVVIGTAVASEIQNVFGNQTLTQVTQSTATTSAAADTPKTVTPTPTVPNPLATDATIGTYKGYNIYTKGGVLYVVPSNGYPININDFLTKHPGISLLDTAKGFIDTVLVPPQLPSGTAAPS
jgi:hypothetical protein